MKVYKFDIAIIGTGLAGLALALKLPRHLKIALFSKESLSSANTTWAQGGVAAVTAKSDSFEKHIFDTLQAGAGLCRPDIVKVVVEQAPDRIQDLIEWGVRLDRDSNQEFLLTREGGHGQNRILHFEDQTGAEIHRALLDKVQQQKNVELFASTLAVDLLIREDEGSLNRQCFGAYFLDKEKLEVFAVQAAETILASGGAGKVYLYTSNWSGATGDGIAMAYRAGAQVANLEFMQFHPTCLYHPSARNFLISEALRGEGGVLKNKSGHAFMSKYHPMKELAPRDIVARSIDAEMKKSGDECVYLDMTHLSRAHLEQRFPAIYRKCKDLGIDMAAEAIPVVPAAHYLCGGIETDLAGKTNISGLRVIGESAHTGLHGANRLASNSLLECLAQAHEASREIQEKPLTSEARETPPDPWVHPQTRDSDETIVIHHMWDEIRRLMWNYVGIVRSNKRLERALHRLQNINQEVKDYYSHMQLHPDIVELRNISLVAELTVRCALQRKESRGIHFNLDYPSLKPEPLDWEKRVAKDSRL